MNSEIRVYPSKRTHYKIVYHLISISLSDYTAVMIEDPCNVVSWFRRVNVVISTNMTLIYSHKLHYEAYFRGMPCTS